MKVIHTQLFWPTWVDSTLLAKTTKTGEIGGKNWYITAKCPVFARKLDFAPNSTAYILPQAGVKGNRNVAFFGKNISVFRGNSAGNFLPENGVGAHGILGRTAHFLPPAIRIFL